MESSMKLCISSSSILLFALTTTAFASYTPPEPAISVTAPGKFYVGVFGGHSSSKNFKVSQYGTDFFTEAAGGPLAVNAFGQLNSESASFFGVQLGYQAQEILLNASSQWTLGPAAELEEYSMSNN